MTNIRKRRSPEFLEIGKHQKVRSFGVLGCVRIMEQILTTGHLDAAGKQEVRGVLLLDFHSGAGHAF